MSIVNLPRPLGSILNQETSFYKSSDLSQIFDQLMIAMVGLLGCDRCYLYFRDPKLQIGQTLHCYCRDSSIPNLQDNEPYSEPVYREEKDPLFAAALQCERTIFIDDIESISPKENDLVFFQQNYKEQKSLIQAHICSNNQLWGIFQASQFHRYRPWKQFDRSLTSTVIDRITPLVSVYVKRKLRHTIQEINDGNH